jgi:hypothetical protein
VDVAAFVVDVVLVKFVLLKKQCQLHLKEHSTHANES